MAAVAKVYNGSGWDTGIIKVYDGSGWVEKAAFYDGSVFVDLYSASGPLVDFTDVSLFTLGSGIAVVANIKWDEDGDVYESDDTGSYSSTDTWLDSGLNTEVWVERTISSGTLTTDGIGSGRVAMTSARILGVVRAGSAGNKAANGTISFYDAASGGNLLRTRNWAADATKL